MDELQIAALALSKGCAVTPKEIQRVGKQTSPSAAAWAFGQWELRHRARAKFAQADQMLFVREALEQATHEVVAEYHASLFPRGSQVADLTVGIGADLIALAKRGPTVGFELDADRAKCADFNLRALDLSAPIHVRDSLEGEWDFEYALADPARRVDSRRTLDPNEFSPNPVAISTRFSTLKRGVIKLSPLLPDPFLESLGPRLEFLSFGGECREVLVMAGSDVSPGRFAVHLESGDRISSEPLPSEVRVPDHYVFDADPAAVRSHALGHLCALHDLRPLAATNGYLTGPHMAESPWLRSYKVVYTGKGDIKTTRLALKDLNAFVFEVKQRGVRADVVKVRKEFPIKGDLPVSLMLWLDGASIRHSLLVSVNT